jgi:hypothetical protein
MRLTGEQEGYRLERKSLHIGAGNADMQNYTQGSFKANKPCHRKGYIQAKAENVESRAYYEERKLQTAIHLF